jgi:hypothetical protein
MTNLLDKFNLGDSFSAIADSPEAFEVSGRTTTLYKGRRISFKGTINGIEVPAYATLHEASLSRMSVIEQQSPYTGDSYKIVTGIFKPVKMDIELVIDGETMSLPELLRNLVNTSSTNKIDEQTFLETASRIGLKFSEGMPMFWQQFGASDEGIKAAFEAFKAAGAVDVLGSMSNRGRIVAAYAHDAGVPVTSFEVGTVDRTKSRTGQGFLNLVDASVEQFQRIVGLRKEASLLKTALTEQTDWAQKKIKATEDRIKVIGDMSRQWTTNWAGAQQIIEIDEAGQLAPQDKYAAVNAPCGRFSMAVDGANVSVDLWKNSARAEASSTTTSVASAPVAVDGELPF